MAPPRIPPPSVLAHAFDGRALRHVKKSNRARAKLNAARDSDSKKRDWMSQTEYLQSAPGGDQPNTPGPQHSRNNDLEEGYESDVPQSGDEVDDPESDGEENSHDIRERLAVMETKVKLVDKLFGIDQPKDNPATHTDSDSYSSSDSDREFHYRSHKSFFEDATFFMGRIRRSHDRIQRFRMMRKEERKAARKKDSQDQNTALEPESAKKISTEAFLKGEPARVTRVDWESFVQRKGDVGDSILSPIDVVIGEPEAQLILQLTARIDRGKGKSSVNRPVDRAAGVKSDGPPGQQPLPERIKVHSAQLFALFSNTVARDRTWDVAVDKSIAFLRPFKELIHYEQQLRVQLALLEKQFENYDGTDGKPSLPGEEGNSCEDTSAQAASTTVAAGDTDGEPEGGKKPDQGEGDTADANESREDDKEKGPDENKDKDGDDDDEKDPQMAITTLLHLRCLMTFFDEEIKQKIEYIGSDQCRKVLFHDLWHLFKPGDEVVDQSEKQAYRVIRVQTPRHNVVDPWLRWYSKPDTSDDEKDKEEDPIIIHCAYIDFDGKKFGPVSKRFTIPTFGRLRDVKALPIYPLRLAKTPNLRQNLIERGKMLLDVAKFKPMYYNGFTLDTRDEIDSQVVVDFNEALADDTREWEPTIEPIRTAPDNRNDNSCVSACCLHQAVRDDDYVDSNLTETFVKSLIPEGSFRAPSLILSPRSLEETTGVDNEPTDAEFVVMTYRVFAFVLRSRKWAQLDLSFLRYENIDARISALNAFDRLELPKGHREMVKSLVTQHFRDRRAAFSNDEQTDLIRGKGKGLILLLHGAPGVGKTTTAEGIAEVFKKPLFQITCGDLGTTAREVETQLEKNFALASRWGCILLLDEADVFLSARERKDFARNGLVAVFLRVLEYYAGILFLTTNRIGDFDEAFASRIHMSLYYPELDKDKTRKVFRLNLDLIKERFDRQSRKIDYDASSIDEFATKHFKQHKYNRWNGRQIRNACQTALALAEFDAHGGLTEGEMNRNAVVKLQLKHFKTVQAAYLDFGKYLGDIRGTQGDRRAIDQNLRSIYDTPYQPKPSRSSMRPRESGTDGDESDTDSDQSAREAEKGRHRPRRSQNYAGDNPFQQSASQGFTAGLNANMGAYGQFAQQGQPMGNMGFSQQGFSQQGQVDPLLFQSQQQQQQQQQQQAQMGFQQGQGWAGNSQALGFNPNAQSLQGQQPQFGFGNLQQGVGGPGAPASMGHVSTYSVGEMPLQGSQLGGAQAGGPTGQGNSPSPGNGPGRM